MSMSIVRSRPPKVTPPDLGLAVNSLADGIQKAVPALYKLQTALINGLPASPIPHQFPTTRTHIKTEWTRCKDLLRRCCIYAEVYVEFAAGSQDLSSGRAYLVPKAKLVYKEAITAKDNYEKLHRELQIYREKLEFALGNPVGRNNAIQPPRLPEGTIPTMGQAALGWAYPDGPRSLTESYSALEQIHTSLGDIVAFWKYHVDEPISTSSEAAWRHFKDVLEAAMYTISASADAICVNAVGAPRKAPNNDPQHRPGGILQTLLGLFRRNKKPR